VTSVGSALAAKLRRRIARLVKNPPPRSTPGFDVPERFCDMHFISRFQADIFRQVWRERTAEDPEFAAVVGELGERQWRPKMDRYALLWQLARSSLNVNGDVIECGVYKGASARVLGLTLRAHGCRKRLLLLDTFSGLPPPTAGKDGPWKAGDLADVKLQEVASYLSDLPSGEIVPGLFRDTFPTLAGRTFCFCHIDCDLYASVLEACEFLYPRTAPGGCLLFDDYGVPYCPGAQLAVDEFFADKAETPVYLPTGQCVVFKLGSM
jgi:O-methyltransferase